MSILMNTIWLILWMLMTTAQEQISDENTVLNYLTKREKPIERATLVMGEVGSGKTTLALLLTGGELYRKRDLASKRYIFIDKDNRIGNGSIKTPKTVIPNLMSDRDDRYDYYFDCPGFSDSRDEDSDFENTLIFQKLYHSAKKLNFIFTVKYDTDDTTLKRNIKNLITYASDIFNNYIKYENSTAIVVTEYPLIDEEIGIDAIKKHLSDIPLKGKGHDFTKMLHKSAKIGFFHIPHILQSDSILGSDNRNALLENVIVQLAYVITEPNDFICTLNKKPQKLFIQFIDRITNKIIENFDKIIEGVKEFISQEERRYSNSLNKSIVITNKIKGELSKVNSKDPLVFKDQFTKMIYNLGIRIAGGVLHKSLQYVEYIQLLHIPEKVMIFEVPLLMSVKIKSLIANMNYSQDWNDVLSGLRQYFEDEKLYTYSEELNETDAIEKGLKRLTTENGQKIGKLNDIKLVINEFYQKKKSPKNIDEYKMKLLNVILQQSTEKTMFNCLENNTYFLVTGYNVQIDSVRFDHCFNDARYIHIFAINKLYFESSPGNLALERHNKAVNIGIISPIWETKHDVNGLAFYFKANNSNAVDQYNQFFGITQTMIINKAETKISNKISETTPNTKS